MGKRSDKMENVAEGVYRRNGRYIVLIWNPNKGNAGGKDWHTLGPERCACGATHARTTANALNDAKRLKGELEQKKQNGRRRAKTLMVADWAGHFDGGAWVQGRWLRERPRVAESTNLHNDRQIRAFARAFADRALESVSEQEANLFALEHPGTLKEVHAMYNDAVALKLIASNPFAGLKSEARRGRKDIVVLKGAEVDQLAAIARAVHGSYGPVFAAMIETAAWTGMRPGELFLLTLDRGDEDRLNWVDLDAGVIYVDWQLGGKTNKVGRPKNGSQREVVLLPAAEKALRSIAGTQEAGKPLFLTKRGKPFNQRTHFYYWDPVRAAFVAALPAGHHLRQRQLEDPDANLDFYELRHHFGTVLAHPPEGVKAASPYEIAAMMGHKDGGQLAMQVYVHTRSEDAQQSIRSAWKRAS